jgi:hypothetical protein
MSCASDSAIYPGYRVSGIKPAREEREEVQFRRVYAEDARPPSDANRRNDSRQDAKEEKKEFRIMKF